MRKFLTIALALVVGMALGWSVRGLSPAHDAYTSVESQHTKAEPQSSDEDQRTLEGFGQQRVSSERRLSQQQFEKNAGADQEMVQVVADDVGMLLSCDLAALEERRTLVGPGDPLARFLKITQDEVGELNAAWSGVVKEMEQARASSTEVRDEEDGSVVLSVNAFEEQGGALKERFAEVVAMQLGKGRAKVFLDAVHAESAYGKWGEVPAAYRISVEVQADSSLLYEVRELDPKTLEQRNKWRAAQIPQHLRSLTDAVGVASTP